MASMNSRNNCGKQNLFCCSYGCKTIVFNFDNNLFRHKGYVHNFSSQSHIKADAQGEWKSKTGNFPGLTKQLPMVQNQIWELLGLCK